MQLIINSNNGWDSIKFTLKANFRDKEESYFVFEAEVVSQFWDLEHLNTHGEYKLVPDKKLNFHQLYIKESSWRDLLSKIESWTNDMEHFEFVCQNDLGFSLHIELDSESPDFLTSKDKPLLTFFIQSSRTRTSHKMIVDSRSFNFSPQNDSSS